MEPGSPVSGTVSAPGQLSREAAPELQLSGGDPERLREFRAAARAAYRELPWPSSSRDEDWRRTPQIDRLDLAALTPGDGTEGSAPPWLELAAAAGDLETEATLVTLPSGMVLGSRGVATSFRAATATGDDGWQALAGKVVAPGARKLVALNSACFTDGALIRVGRGQAVEVPVRLLHGVEAGGACFPRTLIILEEGASLTVLEEWLSDAEELALMAPVVEVVLRPGARLVHLVAQRCGPGAVVQSTVRAQIGEAASYQLRFLATGAAWQKAYFEVDMVGEASEFRSGGLCIAGGRQHFDVQTLQDHMARGAVSDLLYRAAVAEHARSVFAGLIRVEEGAQKTNAYVQNRNLLLSPTAKADSNPTLEILANDVRCTHGTAAGRIDDEQLFYCQSRGLPREAARRLIVEGFFSDVLDGFPEGGLRELARGWTIEALDGLARSGALSAGPTSG